MTARKPVQLSYEALHRIRLAAGGWPADLEIFDLGRQLSKAMWWYDFFRSVNPEATTRSRRMTAIHKHATALSKLLAADEEYEGDAEFADVGVSYGRRTCLQLTRS